jgi:hypothetical protein
MYCGIISNLMALSLGFFSFVLVWLRDHKETVFDPASKPPEHRLMWRTRLDERELNIDGFDTAGFADQFPSKAKQVTTYQWILLIFLVESPWPY